MGTLWDIFRSILLGKEDKSKIETENVNRQRRLLEKLLITIRNNLNEKKPITKPFSVLKGILIYVCEERHLPNLESNNLTDLILSALYLAGLLDYNLDPSTFFSSLVTWNPKSEFIKDFTVNEEKDIFTKKNWETLFNLITQINSSLKDPEKLPECSTELSRLELGIKTLSQFLPELLTSGENTFEFKENLKQTVGAYNEICNFTHDVYEKYLKKYNKKNGNLRLEWSIRSIKGEKIINE